MSSHGCMICEIKIREALIVSQEIRSEKTIIKPLTSWKSYSKLEIRNLMYNAIAGAFPRFYTKPSFQFNKLDWFQLLLSAKFTVISYQTAVDLVFHVLNKSP